MSLNQKTDRPGFGVTSTLGDRFVILFGALGLISLYQLQFRALLRPGIRLSHMSIEQRSGAGVKAMMDDSMVPDRKLKFGELGPRAEPIGVRVEVICLYTYNVQNCNPARLFSVGQPTQPQHAHQDSSPIVHTPSVRGPRHGTGWSHLQD